MARNIRKELNSLKAVVSLAESLEEDIPEERLKDALPSKEEAKELMEIAKSLLFLYLGR